MEVTTQLVRLADLQSHPKNYNQHSDAQIARIAKSLSTFGQVRSIVTRHNTILAGHGVVLAARSLGWDTIRADVVDRLSESEALAYVVADNELARQSDPDQAQLAAILEELQAKEPLLVEAAGYSAQELDALLRLVNPKPVMDAEPQIDRAAELQVKWGTKTGDLWALGDHRLICGDCTDAAVVARVMGGEKIDCIVADPPYGMELDTDYSERAGTWIRNLNKFTPIIGDDRPFDRRAVGLEANEEFWFGGDYYIDTLPNFGKSGAWFVWDKRQEGSLDEMRGNQFELCWSKQKHKRQLMRIAWVGVLGHNKIDDGERKFHPTQKPVKVIDWILEKFTEDSAVIADPFAGSGTTGIACHNLGRRARMVEISPAYCGVILERFNAIGGTPTLIESAVLETA